MKAPAKVESSWKLKRGHNVEGECGRREGIRTVLEGQSDAGRRREFSSQPKEKIFCNIAISISLQLNVERA